jgi:8-oxo-dGTP pyrophosphatase MutT (NUDIX family)
VTLHDAAVAELSAWEPYDEHQHQLRVRFLDHLTRHPDGANRGCYPDHLTGSAIVVDDEHRRVLLDLHRKYRIWVQFGGHCEERDGTLARAALREAIEESGIEDLRLTGPIAQLSRHQVRCGPIQPSHHLDVRYVAVAPSGAEPRRSHESIDVRWFDPVAPPGSPAALPDGLDPDLGELIGRLVAGQLPHR